MNKLHKCHQPSGCAPMQQGFRQGGPYSPRVMAILLPDAARPATQATHSKRDISFYGFPPPPLRLPSMHSVLFFLFQPPSKPSYCLVNWMLASFPVPFDGGP